MSSTTYPLTTRVARVTHTIRWAPAPRWGTSGADHGKYLAYLVGSVLAWIAIGLLGAAALGALLPL